MKTTILAILFGVAVLCQTWAADEPQIPPALSNLPSPVDLTETLKQAKQRFPLLRPDMTETQVFTTLGLASYYAGGAVMGGGPRSAYWDEYELPGGHKLILTTDFTDASAGSTVLSHTSLVSVSLDGATWPLPSDTNNVVAQAKSSTLPDPIVDLATNSDKDAIDNLVAKLTADPFWDNGIFQGVAFAGEGQPLPSGQSDHDPGPDYKFHDIAHANGHDPRPGIHRRAALGRAGGKDCPA